jgi:hypothetical protein
MEAAIPAAVPELKAVKCEPHKCAATLTAASEQAITAAVTALEDNDSLEALGAKHVLLSGAPEQKDGKVSVKLYVQF